jgi:hypothetical protein
LSHEKLNSFDFYPTGLILYFSISNGIKAKFENPVAPSSEKHDEASHYLQKVKK